jgi:hypothetical protein
MKNKLVVVVCLFLSIGLKGQESMNKKTFLIKREKLVYPALIQPDFNPEILNLEAPTPDGNSAKAYLMRQKIESKIHYSTKKNKPSHNTNFIKSGNTPLIGMSFEPFRVNFVGTVLPITAGIPSDNTLAISNDGIIVVGMNSVLYAYDTKGDSAYFPEYQIHLRALINGFTSSSYYDPKLAYDPNYDRFVLTFLKDNTPDKSEVIMCFSSTNNPNDPWYVYYLPGNPLDNNRWTDFPCLALTNDKIFYTANLIIPNEPWQIGFDGSIIWEMDKEACFNGEEDINAVLYSDIKFENRFIRNLHPVNGENGIADELVLLSNRNFDIENDTLFYLRLIDGELDIKALKADLPYGVPPNGRQFDTDISDPTKGLQTNDARVLGAVQFEDEIQFVANSIDPSTGFSAVYHGVISDIYSDTPSVSGRLISDSEKDYAYPNIVASGNESCDREVIIGFNYTSPTHFPGIASVHVNNDRVQSSVLIVKEGYNYVDRLPGGYERWGDYFGLQRKYNEPNKAFSFGYLALLSKSNSGFCAELQSPDSTRLQLSFSLVEDKEICQQEVIVEVVNGTPPFTYYWDNENQASTYNQKANLCAGDTVHVWVVDAKGCSTEGKYRIPFGFYSEDANVYPNPVNDIAAAQFQLNEDKVVRVELFDQSGRLVHVLVEKEAKKGLNEFIFSMTPLASGLYTVVISSSNEVLHQFKVIKM